MNIFKKVISKVKGLFKKEVPVVQGEKNKLYVDLGASSIKMGYENKVITFRSSVREITDINEITIQKNAIKVNDKWFIVGESKVNTGNYKLKVDKPMIDVLICYGIKMLNEEIEVSGNLELSILLPYNQIFTKGQFAKVLNKTFNIDGKDYKLTLSNVCVEGESSKVYVEKSKNIEGNLIVCNIGYSTIDMTLYNSMNCREIISSINIGTNNLLSNYLKFSEAPTSNILGSWLNDGYVLSDTPDIQQINKEYIENIWNDLYNSIVKMTNPTNTTIVFCGGGANLLLDSLKKVIPKDFNIITLNKEENLYSDLYGAMLQNKNDFMLVDVEIEVSKSNYDKFIELIEQRYTLQEISEELNLTYGTVKNYSSKYKKEKEKIVA